MSKTILGYTIIASLNGCISDSECELLTEPEARKRAKEIIWHHYNLNPENKKYKEEWNKCIESIEDRHCCSLPGDDSWDISIVPIRKSSKSWKPKDAIN